MIELSYLAAMVIGTLLFLAIPGTKKNGKKKSQTGKKVQNANTNIYALFALFVCLNIARLITSILLYIKELIPLGQLIFFAIVSGLYILGFTFGLINSIRSDINSKKEAIFKIENAKKELIIKREKEKIGEIYLTTEERESLGELFKKSYSVACEGLTCPICKSGLYNFKSQEKLYRHSDHVPLPGVYSVLASGYATQAYTRGSEEVLCPSITCYCFKCGYSITYIDGFKSVPIKKTWLNTDYFNKDITEYEEKPCTVHSAKWGKLAEFMDGIKDDE
jgi:hypothetical protein